MTLRSTARVNVSEGVSVLSKVKHDFRILIAHDDLDLGIATEVAAVDGLESYRFDRTFVDNTER